MAGRRGRLLRGLSLFLGFALCVFALSAAAGFVQQAVRALGQPPPAWSNLAGAGAALSDRLLALLGVGAAVVPVLSALWGAVLLGWSNRGVPKRWTALLVVVLVALPAVIHTSVTPFGGSAAWATGRLGEWVGSQVLGLTGWLVGSVILTLVLAGSVILTVGTGPLRVAVALGRSAGAVAAAVLGLGRRLRAASVTRRPHGVPAAGTVQPLEVRVESDAASGTAQEDVRGGRGGRAAPAREAADAAARPAPPERPGAGRVGPEPLEDLPGLDLLSPPPPHDALDFERELDALADAIVEKLRTFKIEGRVVGRTTGPVVTQFEVEPASGVKVGKIAALADDLALALRAPSVRIVAPIPGRGAVGVEVPNPEPRVVYLRSILETPAYQRARAELPLGLGEDLTGRAYVADLARMPHLLVAGATGSGKSVCINALVTSLIYRHPPARLRFLMLDPKMVELGVYNELPHLRHPVVTNTQDAAAVLKWLVWEMERRYEWFSANSVRGLRDYNRRVGEGQPIRAPESEGGGFVEEVEPLSYIVLVVDELADLILTAAGEIERPLALLAQKARATGIQLVVATQRPSVNVITGLIKANFPCRIAFRVSSKVDSRTILDQNGAESLLGNGDMLFLPPGHSEPVRIQGAFVSTEDTDRLVAWYRSRRAAPSEEDIIEMVRAREGEEAMEEGAEALLEERDPLFRQAAEIVVQHDQGSTSLLQRRLKIGYGRAARIIDQLHAAGILGPPEGSKPREVLVTLEELDEICERDPSRRRG